MHFSIKIVKNHAYGLRTTEAIIVVKVVHLDDDRHSIWGYEKFQDRLEGMKELYAHFIRARSLVGYDGAPAFGFWSRDWSPVGRLSRFICCGFALESFTRVPIRSSLSVTLLAALS